MSRQYHVADSIPVLASEWVEDEVISQMDRPELWEVHTWLSMSNGFLAWTWSIRCTLWEVRFSDSVGRYCCGVRAIGDPWGDVNLVSFGDSPQEAVNEALSHLEYSLRYPDLAGDREEDQLGRLPLPSDDELQRRIDAGVVLANPLEVQRRVLSEVSVRTPDVAEEESVDPSPTLWEQLRDDD